MNDMGEGEGDAIDEGGLPIRDNCTLEYLLERKDRWSLSRMLSSSMEPHIVETVVGESGVECRLPLIFK